MTNTLRSLAVALALLVALPATAQDIRLNCGGGQSLSKAELSRGTTIVVVWASWSPRSRDIVERVNRLAARWGGQARVVTVNFQEDRGAVDGFLAGKALSVPVCLDTDGSFSKEYKIATLPGLLVVKDGDDVYHGKLPDDPDSVISALLR